MTRRRSRGRIPVSLGFAALLWSPALPAGLAAAQDLNVVLPTDSIDHLYRAADFALPESLTGMRFAEDRNKGVEMRFDDGTLVLTKWRASPRGGDAFNNNIHYEVAAYELQKLFLDEPQYVVPPTAPRVLPFDWYRTVDDEVDETFEGTGAVLVLLQAFLYGVTDEGVFDPARFEADSLYARHWANANLFTYLIRHSDSNPGNLLVSTWPESPRVFAVDNGVAFNSLESNRGIEWRRLHVDRFPAATVERLRAIQEEGLHEALGVLAEWTLVDGGLVRREPGVNLDPDDGVRHREGTVQIGLTAGEIDDVWDRLQDFLGDVDRGRFSTF